MSSTAIFSVGISGSLENPADGVVAGVQHSGRTDVCYDGSGDGERLLAVIKGTFMTRHETR
jgi:hypothetical protein